MIQFIKDSIREMRHVVWPTRKETRKYFGLVLILLVLFGTYLFIFSNIFSSIVFGIKDFVTGTNTSTTTEVDTGFLDDIEGSLSGSLDDIISDEANLNEEVQSNEAISTGSTATGSEQ